MKGTCFIAIRCLFLHRFTKSGIDPWCNGNTPVFGTVILGSSPSGSTQRVLNKNWGLFFYAYININLWNTLPSQRDKTNNFLKHFRFIWRIPIHTNFLESLQNITNNYSSCNFANAFGKGNFYTDTISWSGFFLSSIF